MELKMLKKIVLGTLLVALIGILVAGGVIRTLDKTDNVAEAQGRGYGQGRAEVGEVAGEAVARGQGYGRVRSAEAVTQGYNGGGFGQGARNAERQYPNSEAPSGEQVAYEGTVVQAPAVGVDLVVKTNEGEEVVVGTGPGYMEAQGFTLVAGERVQVNGFWEDEELKATQVTRLADGQTITLRDDYGRPAWSGSGRRAAEQQASVAQGVRGQGRGAQGGSGSQGRAEAPAAGSPLAETHVDDWLSVVGTVGSVDSSVLVVHTDGQEVVVEGRAWRFAQELGFTAQVDDQVTLTGFYEDGEFKVSQIDDATNGETVLIRDETGRPMWAGRGGRGG
jgi:hypothetical protein